MAWRQRSAGQSSRAQRKQRYGFNKSADHPPTYDELDEHETPPVGLESSKTMNNNNNDQSFSVGGGGLNDSQEHHVHHQDDDNASQMDDEAAGRRASNAFGGAATRKGFQSRSLTSLAGKKKGGGRSGFGSRAAAGNSDESDGDGQYSDPEESVAGSRASSDVGGGGAFGGGLRRNSFKNKAGAGLRRGRLGALMEDDDDELLRRRDANAAAVQRLHFGPEEDLSSDDKMFVDECRNIFTESEESSSLRDPDFNAMVIVAKILEGIDEVGGRANDVRDQGELLGQYRGILEDADRALSDFISVHYDHFSSALQNFSAMILNVTGSQDSIESLQTSLRGVSTGLRNHSVEIQQLKKQGLRNVYVYRVLSQVQSCVGAVRELQGLIDKKQYMSAVNKAAHYKEILEGNSALRGVRPLVPVMEFVKACPVIAGRQAMDDLLRCVYRKDKLRGIRNKLFGAAGSISGKAELGGDEATVSGVTAGVFGEGYRPDEEMEDFLGGANRRGGRNGRSVEEEKDDETDDFMRFIPMCVSTLHAVGRLEETHVAFFSASTKSIEHFMTQFLALFAGWYKEEVFAGRISNPAVQVLLKRSSTKSTATVGGKTAGGIDISKPPSTLLNTVALTSHLDSLDDEEIATAQAPSLHLLLSTLLHELSKILRNVSYFTNVVAITQFPFLKGILQDPTLRHEPNRWILNQVPIVGDRFNGIITEVQGATISACIQIDATAKEGGTSYEQLIKKYWDDLNTHNLFSRLSDLHFDPSEGAFNSAGYGMKRKHLVRDESTGSNRRKVTLSTLKVFIVSTGERLTEKLPHLATDKRVATCRSLMLGEFESRLRRYTKQEVDAQLSCWDPSLVWAHLNYHVEHLLGLLCNFTPQQTSSSGGTLPGKVTSSASLNSFGRNSTSNLLGMDREDTTGSNGGGTSSNYPLSPGTPGRGLPTGEEIDEEAAAAAAAKKTTLAAQQQFPTLSSLLGARSGGIPKFLGGTGQSELGELGFSVSSGIKQSRSERRTENSLLSGKQADSALKEAFSPLRKFFLLSVFNLPACQTEARTFVMNCLRFIPELPSLSGGPLGDEMLTERSTLTMALQKTMLPRLEVELKVSFSKALQVKLLETVRESLKAFDVAGRNEAGHELPCTHDSTSASPLLECCLVAYTALQNVGKHLAAATARGKSRISSSSSHQDDHTTNASVQGGGDLANPSGTYNDDMTVALRAVADSLMEEVTMALRVQLKREVAGTMAEKVVGPYFDDAFSHSRTWQWTALCDEMNLLTSHRWIDAHLIKYYQGLNAHRTSGTTRADQLAQEEAAKDIFYQLGSKSVEELRFSSLASVARIAIILHSAEWLSDRYLEFAFYPRLDGKTKGESVLAHRTIVPGSKFADFLAERNTALMALSGGVAVEPASTLLDPPARNSMNQASTGEGSKGTSRHARVLTTGEWTDGRRSALFHQLASVSQAALFYLSVDIRLAAFGYIPQLRDERYDFSANPGRADAFVLAYIQSINRFFSTLSPHLPEPKRKFLLITISDPIADLLIAELSRVRTAVMSQNGVEQLQRNVLSIGQAIQLLLPFDDELRDVVEKTLEKTRLYYSNLLNRNIVQDLIDTDLGEKLDGTEMENLVSLVFRGNNSSEDPLAMVAKLRKGMKAKLYGGVYAETQTGSDTQTQAFPEESVAQMQRHRSLSQQRGMMSGSNSVSQPNGVGDGGGGLAQYGLQDSIALSQEGIDDMMIDDDDDDGESVKVPSYPDTNPPSEEEGNSPDARTRTGGGIGETESRTPDRGRHSQGSGMHNGAPSSRHEDPVTHGQSSDSSTTTTGSGSYEEYEEEIEEDEEDEDDYDHASPRRSWQ